MMRAMLCMGNVGQYAALPAITFGGYFSPFFNNKNQGIYAVDFLELVQCVTVTRARMSLVCNVYGIQITGME